MALSNWDTMAVDLDGKPINGEWTSRSDIKIVFYKNWIHIHDSKGWSKDSSFVEPIVITIQSGSIVYKDIHIEAIRGPQNGIYAAVWDF